MLGCTYEQKPDCMRSNSTYLGHFYPNPNQNSARSWLKTATHEVNRKNKTLEVLAFYGVEYTHFLEGDEKSKRVGSESVLGSLTTGPLRP